LPRRSVDVSTPIELGECRGTALFSHALTIAGHSNTREGVAALAARNPLFDAETRQIPANLQAAISAGRTAVSVFTSAIAWVTGGLRPVAGDPVGDRVMSSPHVALMIEVEVSLTPSGVGDE
jgi:hypothetical protein